MRHYMYITGLILLGLLQGSSTTIQAIPDNQNETPETDRSLPISINQKGDMIYISSNKDISDLQVEITDSFGNVLQEEHISLSTQQAYPIYIGDLSMEESYYMTLRQEGNRIITYSIYK